MKKTKIGIIGCGMISDTYFQAAQRFRNLEVVACSDIIPERSAAKFEQYGVKNVVIYYVGAVIGSHSGPGTLALFYLGSER